MAHGGFADLVRGAGFRGPSASWTAPRGQRFARAVGTAFRRRGATDGTFVVGRDGVGDDLVLRDGLVLGLLGTGFDVLDVDVVESDRFTATIRRGPRSPVGGSPFRAVGGLYLTASKDNLSIMVFAANSAHGETESRPLVGADLATIAALADAGTFATVSGGRLRRCGPQALPWPVAVPVTGAADWAEATANDGA